MLYPLVLICALSTAPDDCTVKTAFDVIREVEPSRLPFQCLQNGNFAAAKSALAQDPAYFVKVSCDHHGR